MSAGAPELFLVVETDTRSRNIGTALRCAVAFRASAVCVYGFRSFSTHGAHGAQTHIPVLHFFRLEDCVAFLRSRGCSVLAVAPRRAPSPQPSAPIESFKFSGSAAFLVATGREADPALSAEQRGVCDAVLHATVPTELEAALHYNAKLAIMLQEFAVQARFVPLGFRAEKYEISAAPADCAVRRAHRAFLAAQSPGEAEATEDICLDGFFA